ncbi:MAG: hypothetical protein GY696_21205 [Gammaproteobacteria bacterium]|nr:hypothetical protein [Gammaproteobacteria bacterium]
MPPTAVDPCAEVKAPPPPLGGRVVCPPPPLPPEGGGECKGGGEGVQEDMKFTQAKIRKRREVCKKEGRAQIQSDINQQKRFNSKRSNTQGRPTVKNMVLNILMACGAMLGVMSGPASIMTAGPPPSLTSLSDQQLVIPLKC